MRKRELNEFEVLEVEMGYVTPCHIPLTWRGVPYQLNQDGYSRVRRSIDGRPVFVLAHRVRYEATFGKLEDGMVPDHLCKHRPCCNPAHMEAVTIAVNNRRGYRTKLTAEQVLHIRTLAAAGMKQKELCERFGMSQSHISNIIRGNYWSDDLSPAWQAVKQRRVKS